MLPIEVLNRAKEELTNWHGFGTSIMEMSHRSKEFIAVAEEAEKDFRDLLKIPYTYKVLFCHGGARAQFAAIPGNLLNKSFTPDYINGGYWSYSAIKEAKKYCSPRTITVKTVSNNGKKSILSMNKWDVNDNNSDYIHFCPNETIDGIAINEQPDFCKKIVVADFSSTILSCPIDINRYGVIYAGAQKNIGPAGLTLVIVREDLLGKAHSYVPSILDYDILSKYNSMFNTPPTFSWYLAGLVFKWLKEKGGLNEINKINQDKSDLLYSIIDKSDFYNNDISYNNRSRMNVPFNIIDNKLEKIFLEESFKIGLHALKGHHNVGGIRASIYNAMPLEGVKMLTDFMINFECKYG